MLFFELFLLAAALTTGLTVHSRPFPIPNNDGELHFQHPIAFNSPQPYTCLPSFPSATTWLPFTTLWTLNREQILSSNGGDTYVQHYVHEAILRAGHIHSVDTRILLAIMLSASKGRATIPCTTFKQIQACGGGFVDAQRPRENVEVTVEGVAVWFERWMLKERFASDKTGDWADALEAFGQAMGKGEDEIGLEKWKMDIANWLLGWHGRGVGFEKCS